MASLSGAKTALGNGWFWAARVPAFTKAVESRHSQRPNFLPLFTTLSPFPYSPIRAPPQGRSGTTKLSGRSKPTQRQASSAAKREGTRSIHWKQGQRVSSSQYWWSRLCIAPLLLMPLISPNLALSLSIQIITRRFNQAAPITSRKATTASNSTSQMACSPTVSDQNDASSRGTVPSSAHAALMVLPGSICENYHGPLIKLSWNDPVLSLLQKRHGFAAHVFQLGGIWGTFQSQPKEFCASLHELSTTNSAGSWGPWDPFWHVAIPTSRKGLTQTRPPRGWTLQVKGGGSHRRTHWMVSSIPCTARI